MNTADKTNATNQLIASAQQGDAAALDMLLRQNMGLIKSVALRFRDRGCDFEDLCQIGSIGMIKAVRGFDFGHGTVFSTYAVPLIMGEIKRFLRDDGMIKVSRELKRRGMQVMHISQKLSHELGREPTLSEVAEAAGLDIHEVAECIEATGNVMSFSDPVGEMQLEDLLGTDHIDALCESIALRQAIGALPSDERKLIYYRYYKNMPQAKVGEIMGVSQVKVSRLEKKILAKLREALT